MLAVLNKELIRYYDAKDGNAVNLYANLARKLRTGLDDTVDTTLGKNLGHQAARNEYGAYKAIEDDAVRALAKHDFAKQRELGGTLLNTFAGEELTRAIMFANPVALKLAVTTKVFEMGRKMWRDPNRKVNELFKIADKYEFPRKIKSTDFRNPALKTMQNTPDEVNAQRYLYQHGQGVPTVGMGAGKLDIAPTLRLPLLKRYIKERQDLPIQSLGVKRPFGFEKPGQISASPFGVIPSKQIIPIKKYKPIKAKK